MKVVRKILMWSLLVIVLLLVAVAVAIQLEPVQNFIVDKLTTSLSKQLNTELEIGRVKFKFFKTIQIED
ncbi:MAG: hypothetical protein AAFO94_12300, partial [Bacteroidota bacterium]